MICSYCGHYDRGTVVVGYKIIRKIICPDCNKRLRVEL